VFLKTHQHIHIAVGAEIIAQGGSEDRQFDNAPPPAKSGYFLSGYGYAHSVPLPACFGRRRSFRK
jgi:hypothetical protein